MKYDVNRKEIAVWRFRQLLYSSQNDGFDAVHTDNLKTFKLCTIDKLFNDVWTQDIIYFYVCVVLLSVLFSCVSIFQTNVALHKIL